MRRSIMRQVREHPLGFLYALLAVCADVVGLWLLYTRKGSADVDPQQTAVAAAVLIIAFTFLVAALWIFLFYAPHNGRGAEGEVSFLGEARAVQLPVGVRRVAPSVWAVMLVLALAHLGAALSDNQGVRLATGLVVEGLDLIALFYVVVAHVRAAGRPR